MSEPRHVASRRREVLLRIPPLVAVFVLGGACSDGVGPPPTDGAVRSVFLSAVASEHGWVHPASAERSPGQLATFHLVPDPGYRVSLPQGAGRGPCGGTLEGATLRIEASDTSCRFDPGFVVAEPENVADRFTRDSLERDGYRLRYDLYTPTDRGDRTFPLIVALHGSAEGLVAASGAYRAPHLVHRPGERIGRPIATTWVQRYVREAYPAFVLAPLVPFPNSPEGRWYDLFLFELLGAVIDRVVETSPIDTERIYVIGHSVGAGVTWSFPAVLRDRFAALVPMAGSPIEPGPGVTLEDGLADEYPQLSVWSFGHVADPDGDIASLRAMRDRMAAAGLPSTVVHDLDQRPARRRALELIEAGATYLATEYSFPCTGPACHWGATDAATDDPLLYRWLFRQRRRGPP